MPMDATPEKRLVVSHYPNGEEYVSVRDTYLSHFVTCPNAAQHRKSKGENANG